MGKSVAINRCRVAELVEQRDELIVATMNISDDVEGSVVSPTVNPQRLANDRGCLHGLHRIKDVDVAESLPLETSHRTLHLVSMAVNHAWRQVSVGPASVPLHAYLLGNIENDRYDQAVVFTAEGNE